MIVKQIDSDILSCCIDTWLNKKNRIFSQIVSRLINLISFFCFSTAYARYAII